MGKAKKSKEMKYDVVTVGSALRDVLFYSDDIDVIPNPTKDPTKQELMCTEFGAKLRSDNVYFEFGGGAANTGVNFAGLGLKTATLAGIAHDADGEAIVNNLQKRGVDTTLLQYTKKHRTGFSFMLVDDATAERTIYIYYGASGDLQITEAQMKRVNTKWFYVSSLPGKNWKTTLNRVMDRVGKESEETGDAQLAWNPGGKQLAAGYAGLKKYLRRTSVLLLNRDEASELVLSHPESGEQPGTVRQMLKQLHAWGPESDHVVVITDGRKGSTVYDGSHYFSMKTPKDKPKSVVGAGDCYGSSFVAGLIRYKGDINKSMKLAQRNATAVIHKVGSQNGMLRWKDLPKSLR